MLASFFLKVWRHYVVKRPADEQPAPLSDGQAALFASLASATPIGIAGYLGDGEARTVAQITLSTGADRRTVQKHLEALRRRGVLDAHDDSAFTRYSVKDIRILQLLELASEIVAARPLTAGPGPREASPRVRVPASSRRASASSRRARARASSRPEAP
jgi:DNA-binding transcriptional ArsR family regulator